MPFLQAVSTTASSLWALGFREFPRRHGRCSSGSHQHPHYCSHATSTQGQAGKFQGCRDGWQDLTSMPPTSSQLWVQKLHVSALSLTSTLTCYTPQTIKKKTTREPQDCFLLLSCKQFILITFIEYSQRNEL